MHPHRTWRYSRKLFFSPYLGILDVIKFSIRTLPLILPVRMLLQFPAINIRVIELLSLSGVWFFTWAAVIKVRMMPGLIWSQRIISRDINGHRIDRFLTAIILYHALSSWWMSTRYGIECQHFSAFRLRLAEGCNVYGVSITIIGMSLYSWKLWPMKHQLIVEFSMQYCLSFGVVKSIREFLLKMQ